MSAPAPRVPCPECDRTYSSAGHLWRHIYGDHKDTQTWAAKYSERARGVPQPTAGPWRVKSEWSQMGVGYVTSIVGKESGRTVSIATLDCFSDDPEVEATAHLIAAAPALLEALEDLLDLGRAGFIQGADIAVTRSVEQARAAIRAAKGEA